MPYEFKYPQDPVGRTPSFVCGNRMEPRTRSAEFNRSLRAEVRDAAWLLARQWQLKEFRAEDRGSPVAAEISVEYAPLNQIKIGQRPVQSFPNGLLPQPLDAMVQAQAPVIDVGMQLQLGVQWGRILRRADIRNQRVEELLQAFRGKYPIPVPADVAGNPPSYSLAYAQVQTAAEAYAVLQAVGPAAINGYDLLQAFAAASAQVSVTGTDWAALFAKINTALDTAGHAALNDLDKETLISQAGQFLQWYQRVYYQSVPLSHDLAAWSVEELAYQFTAAAPAAAPATQPYVLTAREHLGEALDWYTLDEAAATDPVNSEFHNATDLVTTESTYSVPTEIQFIGAPNARWWDFEDAQVDFGEITADSSDLGRMLLQEFMFLYHNDWFSAPYTIPSGSLCTVKTLTITDVFGLRYAISPAGSNQRTEADQTTEIDHDWGRWSLYALSQRGNRRQSRPRLLLPPTAVSTLSGPVIEQVYLAREEATNLVWGVEQIIPDQLGRGMDGTSAAARITDYLRTRALPVAALATSAKLEYKLATPTAENWIPFLPKLIPNNPASPNQFLQVEQGEMLRQVDGLALSEDDQTILPRTSLLQFPEENYLVQARQVPPVGVRIDGNYRRARWFNGTTYTWYGRSRGNGRTGGSSGLAYDQLLPREARTQPTTFAITAAEYVASATATGDTQLRAVAGGVPFLMRVELRELDAAGVLKPTPPNAVLNVTRSQLIKMLERQDVFRIVSTQDAVQLVTVAGDVYVQRASLATPLTPGDKLGSFPTAPAGTSTSSSASS